MLCVVDLRMAASASPIPELENVIQAGSRQRAEALKRITAFS